MHSEPANLIVVCGPTACGKTRLGVDIALAHAGEIISADSRQVYRGMDIGTGKDLDEYTMPSGSVPYHLIDIVEPSQVYSLYEYQRDFYKVFREIRGRFHLPVAVGGTGLYLEAVLRHYDLPNVPADIAFRQRLMSQDIAVLEARLKELSEQVYRQTDLSNKMRIARGIEIALYRQKHPRSGAGEPPPRFIPLVLGVRFERSVMDERIRLRLRERMASGLVDEVRRLVDAGIPPERFSMFGLEYGAVARYLRNEVGLEDMVRRLERDIRRFARRQETWFRGMERRGVPIHWLEGADSERALELVAAAL